MRRVSRVPLILILTVSAACGKKNATGPDTTATATPPAPTRIIGLTGSLAFQTVEVGASADLPLTISNSGNSTLTVSGLQVSGIAAPLPFAASAVSAIAAGASATVNIRFTPTDAKTYTGTLVVQSDATAGTTSLPISGTGHISGPRTQFGSGQYLVNADIVPGRYFAAPTGSGCYFERESGLGGTLAEIIANDFLGFLAGQWIVDIPGSDKAFLTRPDCGTWVLNAPRRGLQAAITPGMWLVGSQITPGIYRNAPAAAGCYWERLRDFTNTVTSGVIANDFVGDASSRTVEIRAGDLGFDTDADCGTWTPIASLSSVSALPAQPEQPLADREDNRARQRAQSGR